MKKELQIPRMGFNITHAYIKWLKDEGDDVLLREPLFIATGPLGSIEFCSPYEGVLEEIFATDGMEVELGTVIAYIATKAEKEKKYG